MSQFDLNVVDVDGAVREAEEGVAGDTRADLFRKAAIGGGAAVGASFFGAMLPELAQAKPSRKQDIKILKFALTLEYLEAEFYERAVSHGGLSGRALDLARLLRDHEKTHVTALRQTLRGLGAKVPAKPAFDFQGTNRGSKFIPTAFVLENTGTRAYSGQAPRLKSKKLLATAVSIALVEGRHAAAIAVELNRDPISNGDNGITPFGAFDRASSGKRILKEVKGTGFIRS